MTLLTFSAIVSTMNTILTSTGLQSEQIIAPIYLLWRRTYRVLKNTPFLLLMCTIVIGVNYLIVSFIQCKQAISASKYITNIVIEADF